MKISERELINRVKKALVDADIFTDDCPDWLVMAARDLIKELRLLKVIPKKRKSK